MQVTSITVERTFFLGCVGASQFPESVRFAISWSLENETVEEAEEKAIKKLYELAERERRRRFGFLQQWAQEKKRREKLGAEASRESVTSNAGAVGVEVGA